MLKFILKLITLCFFSLFIGCSTKPITWEERILKSHQQNVTLAFDEYGDRKNPTMLFLHGFGENRKTWRFLIPKLSKKYHLLMVDFKGFGDSPKLKDSDYSVYDQARFVKELMERKRLRHVTLVGRSFGGGVALILALMQKDKLLKTKIDRLILIDSMAYKQRLPSMMETLNTPVIGYLGIHFLESQDIAEEGYRYAFYNDDLIPKKSVDYTSHYLSVPLAKYAYLETVHQLIPDDIEQVEQRYREIRTPTLILWGEKDLSIRVKIAYRLDRDLPNSQLKIFKKVGHMPQEEAPQKVIYSIEKFMGGS